MTRTGSGGGRRRTLGGLAAALLTGLACAVGPVGGDGSVGEQGQPSGGETTRADGTTSVAEFNDDIRGAVGVAEQYWTEVFQRSGRQFRPVGQVAAYQREGEIACAGQPLPRNNAVYCSAGDFIAYDVDWAVDAFRKVGDAFIFYLLGHEYAHGVQVRLGIQYDYTIEQELQADCMAGAYIGDSERQGRLTLEEGDLEELRDGLRAVADDPGQPWFAEGAHGTAEQRTDAFFRGYEQSLGGCGLS